MVAGLCLDSVKLLLLQLHWLLVHFPTEFKVLVFIFKALNSLGPAYLIDHFLQYRLVHSEGGLLTVPPLREVRSVAARNWAFLVVVLLL